MKTNRLALGIAVVGLIIAVSQPTTVVAGSIDGDIECTQMTDLIAFVSVETGYPPLVSCPYVRVASSAGLGLSTKADDDEPMAIYRPSDAAILLSSQVDTSHPLGRSYLVHELVHAHQFNNGMDALAPCPGWLEHQAYRVQATYLRDRGLGEQALDFEILGMLQGACAQDYF